MNIPLKSLLFSAAVWYGVLIVPADLLAEPSALDQCRLENPAWYQCSKTEDCMRISNPCGWPTDAANKQSAEKAQTCNRLKGAALSCPRFDSSKTDDFELSCIAGVCVAKDTKPRAGGPVP